MKKLFLLFATATLLIGFQACKQKEEAATTEASTEAVSTDAAAATVGDSTAVASDEGDTSGTRGIKNPPPVGP